ncbi:hypothetical protein GH714_000293 [Hevea brasiliensis]|uniref:Reverse transcriptase RNase H-like domain-containing protein n=1 Tax=Hevea brasiliensis TaxID=3981 RepID=A0A6A6MA02_HEVBR|nr:hypothetical protein GH714_000293 [Hevea brasiliensis]
MGDSVQDQLAKLFNLLLAEQQSNKELHAKFDALTQEWESTKKDFQTSSTGSPASLRRDKGISFEALVSRAGTLTQHQKVQLYLSGLQDSIAVEVELHHPTDLVNAMSISRLYERKLFPRSSAARDTRRAAIPPDNRANRIVRRLSPDEMEERRKKGLCFNCDEQFVRGHQCKKLFWIDLEETEDVEDFTADPEISLNAITGIRNPQSMRLIGSWMLGQVLILIDSGSTHSFVSAAKVEELNAVVNKQNGLKVHVANGEQLTSPGICKGIPVLLKDWSSLVTTQPASRIFQPFLGSSSSKSSGLRARIDWLSEGTKALAFHLWGREFIVRTDHYTLKYLLEQRHLSATQQHWISKLLGFSFTVEYRAGKSNVVADALSRRNADDSILMAVSMPQLSLFDEIRKEHSDSPAIQQQISAITNGTVASKWVFRDGLLFYNNRVYLPPNSPSIQLVVSALHNQSHEGYQKTLYRITRDFYWQGMKNFVRDFVRSCDDDMLHLLRQNLLQAQNKMKATYDQSHRSLEFKVGDMVLLRLKAYRQQSVAKRTNHKLSARFYGPFRVLECIGTMAYKLDLPAESKIHPVFHVSYLKPYHAGQPVTPTLPPTILLEDPVHPLAVLDHRIKGGIPEVLIHWSHSSPADASWERVQHITDKFPDFKLADKLPMGAGSNVTKPLQVYSRYTHGPKSKSPVIEWLN